MLEFNVAGLLTPSSVIQSDLNEFAEHFAIDSPQNIRNFLYNQYLNYKSDLKKLCGEIPLKQWIDGSYVTKKAVPVDIDLVTFIDFELAEAKENELKQFIYPASSNKYSIDGYIIVNYPKGHKMHFAYEADYAYWINQFGKTKPTKRHKGVPKGFLEIII